MAPFVSLIVLVTMSTHPCLSEFFKGAATLPDEYDESVIGYDSSTNSILIIGGHSMDDGMPRSLVKFRNDQFFDYDQYYLTPNQNTRGWSQHYTQLGNDLWFISNEGEIFTKVNTQTYAKETPPTSFPTKIFEGACLASIDDYLFVIGGNTEDFGGGQTNMVQIYRISGNQWLTNAPPMTTNRYTLSCIVYQNKLYAIGGRNVAYLATIETLDISNMNAISSVTWDDNWAQSLTSPRKATRAVIYGTDIYVIGGRNNEDEEPLAEINIIDTFTGYVTQGDVLNYPISHAASIIIGNTLYVFGGYIGGNTYVHADTYQYSTLGTLNQTSSMPTMAPSKIPTIQPSAVPTNIPSRGPTLRPSDTPTNIPSFGPTLPPSNIPSNIPTFQPSETPSHVPTSDVALPSNIPSNIPSRGPTLRPSDTPTNIPSFGPTLPPSNIPSDMPTFQPSETPSHVPTSDVALPSNIPSNIPSRGPTLRPSDTPTNIPSYGSATSENEMINLIALSIALVVLVIVLCLCIFVLWNRLKKEQAKSGNDIQMIHAVKNPPSLAASREVGNGKAPGASAPVDDAQIEEEFEDSDSERLYGTGPTDTGGQVHAHEDMKVVEGAEPAEARTEEGQQDELAVAETAGYSKGSTNGNV
eukprot:658514_1